MLSQVVEAAHALALFSERPEGFGYLLKDRVLEIDDFLEALGRVGRGGTAIDPDVIAQLVGRRRDGDPLGELTPRERAVLGLMAEGLSNGGICRRLFLSSKTVETHVNAIFPEARPHARAGRPPARARRARVLARVGALTGSDPVKNAVVFGRVWKERLCAIPGVVQLAEAPHFRQERGTHLRDALAQTCDACVTVAS